MKTQKIKLKIGEFSKLNQVTVKTLRHYEEIGILLPSQVDPWTGYRYYDICQMQILSRIIQLKQLGFGLEEIKELFDDGLDAPTPGMIASKLESCRVEMAALQGRMTVLTQLEKHLETPQKMEKAFIKPLPSIIVASHRRIIDSYEELFSLCPNVIGPEMARLGCVCAQPGYCYTVNHDCEYKNRDIDIEYCEQVTEAKADSALIQFRQTELIPTAVCMYHRGRYDSLPQTFAELYAHLEKNGYKIVGNPRFCYIDGIWNKDTEAEWLTEIQVPATH